jgi:hypothetical protein
MSRALAPDSSVETLKKEAKRWLKALRFGDPEARRRLVAVTPAAPANPNLRDVQLALAREYGLPGWTALRQELPHAAQQRAFSIRSPHRPHDDTEIYLPAGSCNRPSCLNQGL